MSRSRPGNVPPWARWAESLRRTGSTFARRDVSDLLQICAEALWRYKLRTSLSVLGVILGVAAVIAMMSVSEGARREALRQFELLGLDNVVVRDRTFGTGSGLTEADADKLRRLVPLVSALTPLVERSLTVSGPQRSRLFRILGVTHEYKAVLRLEVSDGRFLEPLDLRAAERVCVLGSTLARTVFGYRPPVGESARIGGEWYRVVGVLAERSGDRRLIGALAARDLNQAAIVPLPALLHNSRALDPGSRVDEIWIQIAEGNRVLDVGRVVDYTLSRIASDRASWELVLPRELLTQRLRTQRTFSVVVGSVAVISLLVGGIGIMNIMLASVMERTSEIGIRRAVGATERDVAVQFLSEALLMTLSGGAAGILLGLGVAFAVTAYAGWATTISVSAIFLAFLVSVAVGLVFGIYPATRAARLNPIDAVRFE